MEIYLENTWRPLMVRVSLGDTYLQFGQATAVAAMAAVSARRMVLPKDAAIQPAPRKSFSSDSVQPPSGPKASDDLARRGARLQGIFQHHLFFGFSQHDASAGRRSLSAPLSLQAGQISGARGSPRLLRCLAGDALPALHALLRQLGEMGSVRCAITGTMRATPSSTHFSIAHSMRSNLKMERTRVRLGTGCGRNDFAEFELDPIRRRC